MFASNGIIRGFGGPLRRDLNGHVASSLRLVRISSHSGGYCAFDTSSADLALVSLGLWIQIQTRRVPALGPEQPQVTMS